MPTCQKRAPDFIHGHGITPYGCWELNTEPLGEPSLQALMIPRARDSRMAHLGILVTVIQSYTANIMLVLVKGN